MDKYDKSVNDMRNLAYWASHDASGPMPKWYSEREYNPERFGDLPKPVNVGASMMIAPEYYAATGWIGTEKKTEFYPANKYGIDSARFEFQKQYHTAGIRGVTVSPLYDLRRFS